MPKQRTPEEMAAYQRERRAKQKQQATPGNLANVDTKVCGCQPGNLCIPHAGAAMSQQDRDAILERISTKKR